MRGGCFRRSTRWRRRSPTIVENTKKQKERKISCRLARNRHASEMYRAGVARQPTRRCRPTTCNANASCDGSLSFACGVCVWRFSLCVFSLENPYRENHLAVGVSRNASIASVEWQTVSPRKRAIISQEGTSQFYRPEYSRETGKRAGVKAGAIHALTSDK